MGIKMKIEIDLEEFAEQVRARKSVTSKGGVLNDLWDGVFNHKVGGTGDIVQYAKNQNKKVIHLRCDRGLR